MLDTTHGFDNSATASRERQAADEAAAPPVIAADRLLSLIERVERLTEERQNFGKDIKDVLSEAKSAGFDVPVIRQLLKLRQQEPSEVAEQDCLLDLYKRALGM